jgi:hypothetical protein
MPAPQLKEDVGTDLFTNAPAGMGDAFFSDSRKLTMLRVEAEQGGAHAQCELGLVVALGKLGVAFHENDPDRRPPLPRQYTITVRPRPNRANPIHFHC